MRLAIFISVLISTSAAGQDFQVSMASKVLYADGRKVELTDNVPLTSEFIVKKRGEISLRQRDNGWLIKFDKAGRYKLDSAFALIIKTEEYKKYDSIHKAQWYLYCPEVFRCGTCNRFRSPSDHYREIVPAVQTGQVSNTITSVSDSTFRLERVTYPPENSKTYKIIVWDMFEDILDVITTNKAYADMDLKKYDQRVIIYRVVSEECLQSQKLVIRLNKQ